MSLRDPRGWLIGAAALAASLLGAELLLRGLGLPGPEAFHFLGPLERTDTFVQDYERFWRLREDTPHFRANRIGLRGWLPRRPKGPRDLRIAVVGDSSTFGIAVRLEETYGLRLERELQEALPGWCVETVVAALPGYSSHQSCILYEGEIAPLEPDVTVLYVGAYNDNVAALRFDDAARSALRQRPLRRFLQHTAVGRLLARLFDPEVLDEEEAAVFQRAFASNRAPAGRRVPPARFRENLEALIDAAERDGGRAVAIVPPLPRATLEKHPTAREYRATVREVAEARHVLVCDAARLFDEHQVELPKSWPAVSRRSWPCYADAVHPSAFGHELLAEELFRLLADEVEERRRAAPAAGPEAPVLEAFAPERVRPAAGALLTLRGRGLERDGSFDRLWIGERWISDVHRTGEGELVLALPPDLPPGASTVELVTAAGIVPAPRPIVVDPPRLTLTGELGDDLFFPAGEVEGPPGWFVSLWYSRALRDEPAPTRFGPFGLAADPDGRLEGVPGPFAFERLRLALESGALDAGGRFHWEAGRGRPLAPEPGVLHAQALLFRTGAQAVLTDVATVPIPAAGGASR